MKEKTKLGIFISGGGSNAIKIAEYFKQHTTIEVACLLTNNINSGAKKIGESFDIPYFIFSKEEWNNQNTIVDFLKKNKIDYIILAGFLKLVPKSLILLFPNKIINIHPSLLPKYGGKGMYGHHVHEAVKMANENQSGITIHIVNPIYDEGPILLQKKCNILPEDTSETIAKKVLKLEHKYFSTTIEKYILQNDTNPPKT